jgi:prefoldin subunit 5
VGKQAFLYCAIALSWGAGLVGCTDDSAAVNALQELTTQLSEQAAAQNEEISALTETLSTCRKAKAEAKGRDAVHEPSDATLAVPALEGEATTASLGALKQALNETIEMQNAALADLEAKSERCATKLEGIEAAGTGGETAKKGAGKKGGKKGARKKGGGKKGGGKKGKAAQD